MLHFQSQISSSFTFTSSRAAMSLDKTLKMSFKWKRFIDEQKAENSNDASLSIKKRKHIRERHVSKKKSAVKNKDKTSQIDNTTIKKNINVQDSSVDEHTSVNENLINEKNSYTDEHSATNANAQLEMSNNNINNLKNSDVEILSTDEQSATNMNAQLKTSNDNQENLKTSSDELIKLNIIIKKNAEFKVIINSEEKTSSMSVKSIKKSVHLEKINFTVSADDITDDAVAAMTILSSVCTSVTQSDSKILLEKLKFKQ